MNMIKRDVQGTAILDEHTKVLEQGFFETINTLCLAHGSSLKGRLASARYLLHITKMPPLYISSSKVFLMTSSLRNPDAILVNVLTILHHSQHRYKTEVTFFDNKTVTLDITYKDFTNRLNQAYELIQFIEN